MTESGISKMWRAVIEKSRPPDDPAERRLWLTKRSYDVAQVEYNRAVETVNRAYQELALWQEMFNHAMEEQGAGQLKEDRPMRVPTTAQPQPRISGPVGGLED